METEAGIEKAVTILKQAASTGAVPAAAVCRAFVELEKKKLAVSASAGHSCPCCRPWKLKSLISNSNAWLLSPTRLGRSPKHLMLILEKMQLNRSLQDDSYDDAVGGGKGGKRWRLSFLSRKLF